MKQITADQHLQALALFTMAVQHAREAERFRQGLMRLLGAEKTLGQIDDAIFDDRHQTPQSLNDALEAEGFEVAPPPERT